jgi:hypothetical protein
MLEVVTPAATFDLTTVDAVNAELGIDSNTANDGLNSGYISAASDSIARYCKRILVAQEYAETFYTNTCKNELLLSEYPVAEIASIEENGVPLADDAFKVNADTGAVIRRRNGDIAWWPDASTIIVTYTAGHGEGTGLPSLPPSIERAAILLSCMAYRSRRRDPAIRTATHTDTSVTFGPGPFANGEGGLPPEIVALLKPHKDFRVR